MLKVQITTELTFDMEVDTEALIASGKSVDEYVGERVDDSLMDLVQNSSVWGIGDLHIKEVDTSSV